MRLRTSMFIVMCYLLGVMPVAAAPGVGTSLDSLPDCGFTEASGREGLSIGAVVINFETGIGCAENLDRVYNTASVPKVFIAAAYFEWLQQGYLSESTRLPFTEAYWMGGRSDCLQQQDIGTNYTNRELVELMITCSDNAATWMIMDSVGWQAVQQYVDGLNIPNIGPVIPYSEVDRLKLAFIDPTWAQVPRGPASRYYRARLTNGLEQWFDEIPGFMDREIRREANNRYFNEYDYNTLTPRALADYFIMLREDLINDGPNAVLAWRLFNVMALTQRQFSVQALPGTVLVASKNGFDRGLRAEINLIFDSTDNRIPSGLVITFAQYDELTPITDDLPVAVSDDLNRALADISPRINELLYPDYQEPPLRPNGALSTVTFQPQSNLNDCWSPYFGGEPDEQQVTSLERCFNSYVQPQTFSSEENLAMGLILRQLDNSDTRLVYIFTAPDGRQFSYQDVKRFRNNAGVYWIHPLDMPGFWTINIYMNQLHIYETTIEAV